MKSLNLLIIIPLILFSVSALFIAAMFYYRNLRLEKENELLNAQLEKRNLISIAQGIEIEMLTTNKKELNQEIIDQMLEDYDREVLISMET